VTPSSSSALRIHVNGAEGAPASADRLRAAVLHVLRAESIEEGEFSFTLLGDRDMTDLNRSYLRCEGPTDVIAFSLGGDEGLLGDVYLGRERVRIQAEEHGVSAEEELLRLAIHGTLHLVGWDHPEGPERTESPMFQRQEELLAGLLRGEHR